MESRAQSKHSKITFGGFALACYGHRASLTRRPDGPVRAQDDFLSQLGASFQQHRLNDLATGANQVTRARVRRSLQPAFEDFTGVRGRGMHRAQSDW
jgi:hypothetical protein